MGPNNLKVKCLLNGPRKVVQIGVIQKVNLNNAQIFTINYFHLF